MAADDRAVGRAGSGRGRPYAGACGSLTVYLLDTNIISDIVRHPDGKVTDAIALNGTDEIVTSVVVAAELKFWVARNGSKRLADLVATTLVAIPPLALPTDVADIYANVRHALERPGQPIGANDLMIACHALSLGAIMVTDNVREFARVPGLDVQNWLRPFEEMPPG